MQEKNVIMHYRHWKNVSIHWIIDNFTENVDYEIIMLLRPSSLQEYGMDVVEKFILQKKNQKKSSMTLGRLHEEVFAILIRF